MTLGHTRSGSANGRLITPSFSFCPENSRLRLVPGSRTGRWLKPTILGSDWWQGTANPPLISMLVAVWVGPLSSVQLVFERVSVAELLPHLEAILTVYNLAGRRDNKYKARIKILLQSVGISEFKFV